MIGAKIAETATQIPRTTNRDIPLNSWTPVLYSYSALYSPVNFSSATSHSFERTSCDFVLPENALMPVMDARAAGCNFGHCKPGMALRKRPPRRLRL